MHPGCTFSNEKPYALKRHFEGSVAKKTHTREDWENSIGDTVAVEPNTISRSGSTPSTTPDKVPQKAAIKEPPITTRPDTPDKTTTHNLSSHDIDLIVSALAKEVLADTSLRQDFVQALAIEAAAYPNSAFCKEPDALVRNMEGGMRLWRTTMVSDTGSGLVELLTTKHIILFKNLKPSYDDNSVSVYRGGKVWVSISYHEAAVSMLQRAEHDMLALYDANDTSPDPAYRKYRSQMERFQTSVGCKLGWDHTPYEMVSPQGVFVEAFYESIVTAIISSIKHTFSG